MSDRQTPSKPTAQAFEAVGSGLDRARVPGGWLYRTTAYVGDGGYSVAMAFVPDASGQS